MQTLNPSTPKWQWEITFLNIDVLHLARLPDPVQTCWQNTSDIDDALFWRLIYHSKLWTCFAMKQEVAVTQLYKVESAQNFTFDKNSSLKTLTWQYSVTVIARAGPDQFGAWPWQDFGWCPLHLRQIPLHNNLVHTLTQKLLVFIKVQKYLQ